MPRRSKLDEHADWLSMRSNQDSRTIAKDYSETFGTTISHVSIANWMKKNVTPQVNKALQRQVSKSLGDDKEIVAEALSKYAALCSKSVEEMSMDERNYFRTVGEWFDRIAKLRGLYGPTVQNQVQVNLMTPEEFWSRLKKPPP